MMIKLLAPMLLAFLGLAACVDKREVATPKPTEKMAVVSGKPYADLKRGYEIYRSQCVMCHDNRLPASATLPEYHEKVAVMASRAGLSKAEEAALQIYLDEFSDR